MASGFISTRKFMFCLCLAVLSLSLLLFVVRTRTDIHAMVAGPKTNQAVMFEHKPEKKAEPAVERFIPPPKLEVDNTGAQAYLNKYRQLFANKGPVPNNETVPANPNNPDTIKTWWQAAAMIQWYYEAPMRYKCKKIVKMGNWHICQDEPYTIKPPCLVYSFGINNDFSFDDDMGRLGCEVHSFDPSMHKEDHKRSQNVTFHNMGLSHENTDSFNARYDVYVKKQQIWKMRTVKGVMEELGHTNRVIDVFKMDIEAYEWRVLDNMMETEVFKYIRQYMLEFHIFKNFPPKEEFVNLYKIYTKFRSLGLLEYIIGLHPSKLTMDKFNIQGDVELVNSRFSKERLLYQA